MTGSGSSPQPLPTPPLDSRGLPIGYPFKPEWEVTPRQVKTMRDDRANFILLDCRRPEEFQLTKLEGSVLIPMSEIEKRADELEDDDGGRTTPIVVMCHHGQRSLRVTAALRAMGFTDVKSMAGGIDAWSLGVDAGVRRY